MRKSPDKQKIGYCPDWNDYKQKKDVLWFPVSDGNIPGIYWFENPKVKRNYANPQYCASITQLEIMENILEYHLNNAEQGFAPNVVINMNGGVPDEQTQKMYENKLKEKFAGSKGQRFILCFNDSTDQATTIEKLDNDNLDQKFETLQKFIQNQIIIGHKITSGQLIGVKPENTGFSKTEYEESLEVFKTTVIKSLQQELEYGLEVLLGEVHFINEEPETPEIKEEIKEETEIIAKEEINE